MASAPILPIPNIAVPAVHTLLYMVLHCHAGLLHCPQDLDAYPKCHVLPVAPESPCSTVRSLFCHEEQSDKQWHPWCHAQQSPSIWLGKDSEGTSVYLEIHHVATQQTDVSVFWFVCPGAKFICVDYSCQELIAILLPAFKVIGAYCVTHPPLSFHQYTQYLLQSDFE